MTHLRPAFDSETEENDDTLWTVIVSDVPLLDASLGPTIYAGTSAIEKVVGVSSHMGGKDTIVWVPPGLHALPLVKVRCSGQVLIQASGTVPRREDWPILKSLISRAIGPVDVRRRWVDAQRRLTTALVDMEDITWNDPVTDDRFNPDKCNYEMNSYDTSARNIILARVRRSMDDFCRELARRAEARLTIARAVDASLCKIKERLWRPTGTLMRKRFAELPTCRPLPVELGCKRRLEDV
jgi:hypothetical protein